ncbi:peroxisomal (s)-2-hydroxy-acid oxidase glo4, partial [Quercus suber]
MASVEQQVDSNAKSRVNPDRDRVIMPWLQDFNAWYLDVITNAELADYAIKAVEVGVARIVVSNHGARQLDYTPATITVLEEVVHAVGGKVLVFLDGGVWQGTDVFKALALGAQAVLIGRPVIYGLAAKGEYGVRKVIQMLKDELELAHHGYLAIL